MVLFLVQELPSTAPMPKNSNLNVFRDGEAINLPITSPLRNWCFDG